MLVAVDIKYAIPVNCYMIYQCLRIITTTTYKKYILAFLSSGRLYLDESSVGYFGEFSKGVVYGVHHVPSSSFVFDFSPLWISLIPTSFFQA